MKALTNIGVGFPVVAYGELRTMAVHRAASADARVIVDAKGHKLSKSKANTKGFGAARTYNKYMVLDIVRLWSAPATGRYETAVNDWKAFSALTTDASSPYS